MKHSLFLLLLLLPVRALAQVPETNYDESKVPAYTLPEVLVTAQGKPVRSVRQWEQVRRPELLELFETEMFGKAPAAPEGLHFKVEKVVPDAFGGLGTLKEVTLYFDERETLPVHLLIALPGNVTGPAPAFLGINFLGNQATTDEPSVTIPGGYYPVHQNEQTYNQFDRNEAGRRWPYQYLLYHGYAVVTYCREDVDPDYDDGFRNGVHALMDGNAPHAEDAWGTIAAWAWSLSRVLDYLEQDPDIDAGRVAVVGHSRLGKAALWAGATDPRFAMVISNGSGCGGAALSRRHFGETVERINTRFPHWFCDNFKKYNENEAALPFDQHELLALIAPRPLYVESGSLDLWADPRGEYLSLYEASKVYGLYGYEVLPSEVPGIERPVVAGRTGYHKREGKHDILLYDWIQYVAFADRFLK